MLKTQGLAKRYTLGETTVHALSDADLRVGQGEFVAIMGPSGSGKSTLLHLMGGLDSPSDGQVLLAGRPLALLTDDEVTVIRRRQIGFVFQFLNLLPTLTAAENIALPLLLDGWRMKDCMARVQELLDLVGLSSRRDHRPDQLSGGEQQRVAIARALVAEPVIVVADEPTGNLDTRAGREVLRLLRRACDEKGQTIVMVTHDPLAASFADRVVFLRDGRIVHEMTQAAEHGSQAILALMASLED